MDTTLLAVIIPAALALIGTVITVIVQMRQPKQDKRAEAQAQSLAEKQAVYKELWEKIEAVHVAARRAEHLSAEDFNRQLADVNSLIMTKSLFVDKQDWDLANRYLKAVRTFKEMVEATGDALLQEEVASTGEYAVESPHSIAELVGAMQEVNRLRDALLGRFQTIINAKS